MNKAYLAIIGFSLLGLVLPGLMLMVSGNKPASIGTYIVTTALAFGLIAAYFTI